MIAIGMVLVTTGLIGPAFGQPLASFGPGGMISFSTPGAIYVNQATTISAYLDFGSSNPAGGGGQVLSLYVDGVFVTSGTTGSNYPSVALVWTPQSVGVHTINVTWSGNSQYPHGSWASNTLTVSSTPVISPPIKVNQTSLPNYLNVFTIFGSMLTFAGIVAAVIGRRL
jgi:hypothetical protein